MGSKTALGESEEPFSSRLIVYARKMVDVIASVYPTPMSALLEAIQNALDADAKLVHVVIDLYGSRKPANRHIIVRDNGKGMSRATFSEKMGNVGRSEKEGDVETLGRHGLGLMSFVGKAGRYTCTTGPKAAKGNRDWEGYSCHDLANIKEVDGELIVECDPLPELTAKPAWWNTEISVSDINVRRLVISPDALADEIRSHFNIAMLKNDATITIHYTDSRGKVSETKLGGHRFVGERFKNHVVTGSSCGRVTFEMYRLKEPTGVVTIKTTADSYTKDWKKMRDRATEPGVGMPKELADALGSGYFEGVITVENCEWDFDRRGFMPKNELAWFELVLTIVEWMNTADVQRHLREVINRKEEEVEHELLLFLSDYFVGLNGRDPDLLYEAFSVLPAGVSTGHTKLEDGVAGYVGRSSKPPGKIVRTETEKGPKKERGKTGERKNQTHFSVERDKGNARYVSKSQLGLAFSIRSIAADVYYEWDTDNGILAINRDNPYYQAIKSSDDKIRAYLIGIAEWAICRLLTDESMPAVSESLDAAERQMMRFLTDRIGRIK